MRKVKSKVIKFTLFVVLVAIIITGLWLASKIKEPVIIFDEHTLAENTEIELPSGNSAYAEIKVDKPGKIGAILTDLTPTIKHNLKYTEDSGIYVQDTYLEGPAQVAGLLPGDILIDVNNTSAQDLLPTLNLIAQLEPGKIYPFTVYREGKYLNYTIVISDKLNYHG